MKIFYKALAILLGYGIIIAGFILFGATLKDEVRILDIVVSCVMFTQIAEFFFFPLIDTNKKAHKEVGMIGIHFAAIDTYFVVAIAIIAAGIYWNLSFTLQLLLQLGALFLLVLGRVATLHSGDKVEQVYKSEQILMNEKQLLKDTMEDLMDKVAETDGLTPELKHRLNEVQESVRFVSPSASGEARELVAQFTSVATNIAIILNNLKLNAPQLEHEICSLERIMKKIKEIRN